MELTILGTGNAMATACYNTCFLLEEKKRAFLVDGGGGNGILSQFKAAQKDWNTVRTILSPTSTWTICWAFCGLCGCFAKICGRGSMRGTVFSMPMTR